MEAPYNTDLLRYAAKINTVHNIKNQSVDVNYLSTLSSFWLGTEVLNLLRAVSIFTSERSSRKLMARPDKVCGSEEDGKMRPGKLYRTWGNRGI